jgi:hypothetical protein
MTSASRILYILGHLLYALIRVLSGLVGSYILYRSATILAISFAMASGGDTSPHWTALAMLIGLAFLVAAGFLYVCVFGDGMRRSKRHRIAAGILLALPILGSATLALYSSSHPELDGMTLIPMAPAALIFLLAVWPGLPVWRAELR